MTSTPPTPPPQSSSPRKLPAGRGVSPPDAGHRVSSGLQEEIKKQAVMSHGSDTQLWREDAWKRQTFWGVPRCGQLWGYQFPTLSFHLCLLPKLIPLNFWERAAWLPSPSLPFTVTPRCTSLSVWMELWWQSFQDAKEQENFKHFAGEAAFEHHMHYRAEWRGQGRAKTAFFQRSHLFSPVIRTEAAALLKVVGKQSKDWG